MEYIRQAVKSLAGHDKGTVFCVVGMDGKLLLLADGRRRKVQKPKRKQLKHLEFISNTAHSGPLTNKAIRQYLRGIVGDEGQVLI